MLRAVFATLAVVSVLACFAGMIGAGVIEFFNPWNRVASHTMAIGFCLFFAFGIPFVFIDAWLTDYDEAQSRAELKPVTKGHGTRAALSVAAGTLVLISGAYGAQEGKIADDDSPCGPYVAEAYCQGRAVLTFEQFLALFHDNDAHDYARYLASPGKWLRDDNVTLGDGGAKGAR